MSLYRLADLDLSCTLLLRNQLTSIPAFNPKQKHRELVFVQQAEKTVCSLCKRPRYEQLLLLINFSQRHRREDVVLICSRCRFKKASVKKNCIVVSYKTALNITNAVLKHEYIKEGTEIVEQIIAQLYKINEAKKFNVQSLVRDIKDRLIGWGWDESDEVGYGKYPRRTCELLSELFCDLRKSYIIRYYKELIDYDFKLQPQLANALSYFCRRQKAFKLSVLKNLLHLTRNVKDTDDLSKWIRIGLDGVNNFCSAFAVINRNQENVLFSVCRRKIQIKNICDVQQGEKESEFLITEFPMNQRPFRFKVSSSGYEDSIEIGFCYAKKSSSEGKYEQACPPVLHRFRVCVNNGQMERQHQHHEVVDIRRRYRLDKSSKSFSESKMTPQGKMRKERPVYQIQDEDTLQLTLDYKKETFKIVNQTHGMKEIESMLKPGSTRRYLILPCIRLIGSWAIVQSLN